MYWWLGFQYTEVAPTEIPGEQWGPLSKLGSPVVTPCSLEDGDLSVSYWSSFLNYIASFLTAWVEINTNC